MSGVYRNEYTSKRHTKCASLSTLSSTRYVGENVIALSKACNNERLLNEEFEANASEVLLRLRSVYRELSSSWTKIYTSYRFLAASDRMKSTTLDHL
jgi:hypothetical protein